VQITQHLRHYRTLILWNGSITAFSDIHERRFQFAKNLYQNFIVVIYDLLNKEKHRPIDGDVYTSSRRIIIE